MPQPQDASLAGAMTGLDPRLERVCDYIAHHLDDELSLDVLSRVGYLSRFHFHRLFSAGVGVTLGRFVQLQRLRRASFRLAFEREWRILDIGLEAGFESAEAFSRAFKRELGQSPSAFRHKPDWARWQGVMELTRLPTAGHKRDSMNIKIISINPIQVAWLEHQGEPARVMETSARFIEWRKSTGLSPIASSRTFGIPNGDPASMLAQDFRFKVCGSVASPVPANAQGVENGLIDGGRYAVIRHVGSLDKLDSSIYSFFRDWLPSRTEEVREAPLFFEYLNFIHQVPESELVTDIHVPLIG